jgi:N-acetylneuraminic acid mutarotase
MKSAAYLSSILDDAASASRRVAVILLSQMVRTGTLILLTILCLSAEAQTLEWIWMGGSSTTNCGAHPLCGQQGIYGTLGTFAAENIPGGRGDAVSWIDSSGHLWLFGGMGFDAKGNWGDLNDLWEFNSSTNEWAWMGGSSTVLRNSGRSGVYGTLGTPAAGNIPGSRYSAIGWTDSSGHLWLFGGYGYDGSGKSGFLNDLWEFDPPTNEWAWMGGSSTISVSGEGQPGVYGTLGTAAAENIPGGREDAVSWTDSGGDLWLFGGAGYDANGNSGDLNDLWKLNPSNGEWTWMSGSSTVGSYCSPINGETFCGQPGVYGALGTAAAENIPGGREGAVGWTDSDDHLWLFGGTGYAGFFNDLWAFDPFTNEWTWMGGSSNIDAFGVYGTLGTAAVENIPGGRYEASTWPDGSGNLWLFGGSGYAASGFAGKLNDLWEFNPSINEWAWRSGSQTVSCTGCGPSGVYGALGIAAASNTPGGRSGAVTWADGNGSFWLFGGFGFDAEGHSSALNDLWMVQTPAATTPAAATPTISPAAGSYPSAQSVTISDRTIGATIYYTTDGTVPTTSSTEYTDPIAVTASETIQAIATATGTSQSAVATALYRINLAVPTFTVSATAVSVAPGATTGNISTITIAPSGGFTGKVTLAAAITSTPSSATDLPTFSFGSTNPVSISGTTAGTATLNLFTTAASRADRSYPLRPNGRWHFAEMLVCLLFFCAPVRRPWRRILGMFLLLAFMMDGALACGGAKFKDLSDGFGSSGTTAGAYTITVTGTSGAITATGTFVLTVQ